MDFAFDAAKSAKNTRERGLPIDRVVELDWGRAVALVDDRFADVRFEHAQAACEDAFALVERDDTEDYGEERFILTGRAADGILTVVYTERNGRIRIISAREANDYERRNYYRAAQED